MKGYLFKNASVSHELFLFPDSFLSWLTAAPALLNLSFLILLLNIYKKTCTDGEKAEDLKQN